MSYRPNLKLETLGFTSSSVGKTLYLKTLGFIKFFKYFTAAAILPAANFPKPLQSLEKQN